MPHKKPSQNSVAHSHKHLFLTLASAGQIGRLCLSHRSALSGSVPHVSHSSRTVVYLGGHVLLLTMATVQEDNSKCTGTFQAPNCITSADILLAKASHMTKLKEEGKGCIMCLWWRNGMASLQMAPNAGRGEDLGLIIQSVATIDT